MLSLISATNKAKIEWLASELFALGSKIISTGNTAKTIRNSGTPVKDVSEHTGFPEIFGGRVKTLHPIIAGGVLWRRNNDNDAKDVTIVKEKTGMIIEPIDIIVVNLYEFEKTANKPGVTLDEVFEEIDIGGPTMLREAAKSYKDVSVIVDPNDYEWVVEELRANKGKLSIKSNFHLAKKVFKLTSHYDSVISEYLEKQNVGGG